MKITVITGSPHRNGASALLADQFIQGAREAGHDVFRFDAAFEEVASCLGCNHCRTSGICIRNDSMNKLNPELLASSVVVFVTPLYYHGMSAQLKAVIDRFYSNDPELKGSGKRAILMATSYASEDWIMQDLASHYETIVKYLKWRNSDILLAKGCGTRVDIEKTDYPSLAYQMGKGISADVRTPGNYFPDKNM
jgi:multimeric flavodoxin WrbA